MNILHISSFSQIKQNCAKTHSKIVQNMTRQQIRRKKLSRAPTNNESCNIAIVSRMICLPNFPIAAAAAEPTMPPPAMTTSAWELEVEEDIITREEAVWRGGARVS